MLDEEMDHIIREAAENHHPAYNDKAWEKMELQLDKHLPQKKDRRRLVFFLLLFLLLGGGLIIGVDQMTGNKKATADNNPVNRGQAHVTTEPLTKDKNEGSALKDEPGVIANTDNTNNTVATTDQTTAVPVNSNDAIPPQINTGKELAKNSKDNSTKPGSYSTGLDKSKTVPGKATNSKTKNRTHNKYNGPGDEYNNTVTASINKKNSAGNKGKMKGSIIAAKAEDEPTTTGEKLTKKKRSIAGKTDAKLNATVTGAVAETEETIVSTTNDVKQQETPEGKVKTDAEPVKDSVTTNEKDKELAKKAEKPDEPKSSDKKKKENKFGNNFGITLSAGPDLSFVKLNKVGKATITYGAGISYHFAKRFTVRTGFYFSKKIYAAAPDEYSTPGGVIYPYFTGVDANCKVYEIPVDLSYHFWQRKRHNWFGNIGLSSYIMKTEDYIYNYKTPSGQTYNYYMGVKNANKHYFSVLNLSAGYQYQLSKRILLQAEPYFQLPLSGVGMGKIKLKSAGVLFTVTVKPFARKK